MIDLKYCTSMIQWRQYKFIAHIFPNEKKPLIGQETWENYLTEKGVLHNRFYGFAS